VVPAGTPQTAIDALSAELHLLLATPDIVAFMAREGAEPAPSSLEDFGRHIAAELQRWSDLVVQAGLKAEQQVRISPQIRQPFVRRCVRTPSLP
jgi:tripartite-type tricarboxylate transporter receptor subunit TctC